MQKQASKILTVLSLFVAVFAYAQPAVQLQLADSLFAQRQFTQSLEKYEDLLNQNVYSPAMLLRMSRIEEGLGHVDKSLYYLNLAYQATYDSDIESKMKESASKNGLDGYTATSFELLLDQTSRFRNEISFGLVGLLLIIWAAMLWIRLRKHQQPIAMYVVFVLLAVGTIAFFNFSLTSRKAILTTDPIYVMSGPSSGADVVAVLKPGHRITIKGRKDVWLHITWNDKTGYVKEGQLLKLNL